MEEKQTNDLMKKIRRKGLWKNIEEILVKHMGATGYAIQGFLGGFLLHLAFWVAQYLQKLLIIDDTMLKNATIVVGVLDACAIIFCAFAGVANLGIHLYHDVKRSYLKESNETKKIQSKYASLPGKTAKIATELAEDIGAIEVEDDENV